MLDSDFRRACELEISLTSRKVQSCNPLNFSSFLERISSFAPPSCCAPFFVEPFEEGKPLLYVRNLANKARESEQPFPGIGAS
ncbi:hypothetical protein M758_1G166100 [Ceratodon purpureus]|nr:hypothetical protein M758_1G166100 [Ceratodon purpureus]